MRNHSNAFSGLLLIGMALGGASCAAAPDVVSPSPEEAFLDDLEKRTFDFFWETANPENGMVPDRWPSRPFASIAAIGFGLTAYGVGVERAYITREQGRERTANTLRFLWQAPQGPGTTGIAGYRGFYYHFLNMETGLRNLTTELSTIDTALLLAGVLFAQSYFDGNDPAETEIRALADSIYLRVEWPYFQTDERGITMAWRPEPERLFGPARWNGYDESMILHVLALGSPTHPAGPEIWDHYTSSYDWGEFYGQEHLAFTPLFGHQYSHVWIDYRGIQDEFMREKGIDYFENSRRATLAQRAYAQDNPDEWTGYGGDIWGLTASDGPRDTLVTVDGRERRFHGYWARGASMNAIRDDGTLVPTAAGGSIPFAPEITIPALMAMKERYGDHLYQQYGFLDAFNPTFDLAIETRRGDVVPGIGWFDDDYLGIDQGPIVLMIENHRTGVIWETMKKNQYIVRGLCRMGFGGGWLEGRCT
jgi:hypothetical protein